jgi:hypothetical protein
MASKLRPLDAAPATPRNIVPLITPEQHAAFALTAPSAQLSYHGGPLLSNVQVQAIFWGTAWQQPSQVTLIQKLGNFFTFILKSSLMDFLAEYGVAGKPIGHGQFLGSITTTAPVLGSTVTDAQIQQALKGWIQSQTVVQPNANTLYFVYLPPGVTSTQGGQSSCAQYCGYHNHIVNPQVFYAVEPFLNCAGCNFGSGVFDSLTKVSSHELCEAITDPALNAWWDSSTGNEIGDICNGGVTTLGGYVIQTEWSNLANACTIMPRWDKGFSGFASVDLSGAGYMWAYRVSDATVCIHKIAAAGAGFTQTYMHKWDTGFSSFAGFSVAGIPYVWAYRASDGTTCIHQINSGGFTQKYLYKWDKGFSGFAAVLLSGVAYVWAYRAGDATVCIHKIAAAGAGFTQTYMHKWDTGFSSFAGFSIAGIPYVWAYRASDGTTCIHQINSGGFTQKYLYKWDTGFSGFAAVDLSGAAYMWAYRASDGTVCIHKIAAAGAGFTQTYIYKWDTGFSSFAGFSVAGIPYVWAYRASDGTVCIHRINPLGASFTQTYPT